MAHIYWRSEAARPAPAGPVERITIFRCPPGRYMFLLGGFSPDSAPLYVISRAFTVVRVQRESPHLNPVIFYCGFHPRAILLVTLLLHSLDSRPYSLNASSSYFYSLVEIRFLFRELFPRAVVSLVSADIRDDVTLVWILFM